MSELSPPVVWGIAQVPHPRHTEPGDAYLIRPHDGGVTVAVIDGLGHGPKAADAAQAAVEVMEKQKTSERPAVLIQVCDKDVRVRRRGLVMSAATINNSGRLVWAGVGNVHGTLYVQDGNQKTKREHLHLRGGTVGLHLPTIREFELDLHPGDTIIFVTDGIKGGYNQDVDPSQSPQSIADFILEKYNRGTDDALVVVGRFTGVSD